MSISRKSGASAPENHPFVSETAELQALAECCWHNQANLIIQAAKHFDTRTSFIATVVLPVVLQAMAGAQPDKRAMKRLVNEAIDKGFDDWLRTAPVLGGVQ